MAAALGMGEGPAVVEVGGEGELMAESRSSTNMPKREQLAGQPCLTPRREWKREEMPAGVRTVMGTEA